MATPMPDLTRTVLAVLFLTALIGGSFWILRPFLLAIIWAVMIVVSTWPLMLRVEARVKRRGLAVAVMTVVLLLIFVVPLSLAVGTIVENADQITNWAKTVPDMKLPPPPDLVYQIPFVGTRIGDSWAEWAAAGVPALIAHLEPYARETIHWLLSGVGGLGIMTVQFLLTVVVSAIMYASGETAAAGAVRFGLRLAGNRGEDVVRLAGQAIRGVALGVVVTALIQSMFAGIGLAVAGIPFAAILTAIIFLLCIAQIGPLLVLAPAVGWLYWQGNTGWGTALLVWSLLVGTMDNFIRPMLIRRGADLPLLLIFAGVIGGLLSFGIIGLFVGPVVLAVTYTLFEAWVTSEPRSSG
jgi:predicted PurR-regulated permease PerM